MINKHKIIISLDVGTSKVCCAVGENNQKIVEIKNVSTKNINFKNYKEKHYSEKKVILLNPKNEEAIYMLALLKIKQSNYQQAKELAETFDLVCESLCLKKSDIKNKLENSIPDDEGIKKQ